MTIRLRTKLAFLMSGAIGGMSLLIALYAPSVVRKAALREAVENVVSLSQMAAFNVSSAVLFNDQRDALEALNGLRALDDFAYVNVRMNGKTFLAVSNPLRRNHVQEVVSPVMNDGRQIATVTLGISLDDVYDDMSTATKAVTTFAIVMFIIGMAASFGLATLITRPLQRITNTAEQVRQGRLDRRADVHTRDEVGSLATTFNGMLDGLESAQGELQSVNQQLAIEAETHRRVADERERLAHEIGLVLESTGDGIIATDGAGLCVLVNRAAKELLGRDSTQVIGHRLRNVIRPVHRSDEGTIDLIENGQFVSTRLTALERFDHTTFSVDLSSAPIIDNGLIVGTTLTFRDVTERESLRRCLDAASRLTVLGRIAASIAHEINNVLMGIQPFAEIIAVQTANDQRIARHCQAILQSVKRGKRVTSEVLQFARPSEPAFAAMDAGDWIRTFSVDQQAALGGTHRIEIQVPPDPVTISVDREQLEQVFANLISNARDAMPGGGPIAIHATTEGLNTIHFEITDKGSGMSREIVDQIFEPFFTTKGPRGTGLGLAIAQQIVFQHGGQMHVESTMGAGTTFHVVLPTVTGIMAPVVHATAAAFLPLSEHVVVVVEDDPNVASGIAATLENAGASVELLSEGGTLLSTVRRIRPDAVVLDISLPDVDGIDVYHQLHSEFPQMPVVFSSGHTEKAQISDILTRLHVRFLQKPYAGQTLVSELVELC